MKYLIHGLALAFAAPIALAAAPAATAQEFPADPGQFWDVTGIYLEDGQGMNYMKWLGEAWKADQEFAKSKGWISGYKVLSNNYKRADEPDLYLIVMYDDMPNAAESMKQRDEYVAWQTKSMEALQAESGGRVKMRRVGGTSLLQEVKLK